MPEEPPSSDPLALARHATGLRRLAVQLVGASDGDDLAQEAFLRGMQRPPPEGYSPAGWLRGLARNIARERRRSDDRRRRREARAPAQEPGLDTAVAASQIEQVRMLAEAMARLPEAYRAVVWYRYFAGHTAQGIAEMLGEPAGTVRTRLKRALDRLRHDLDARQGGDDTAWRVALAPLAASAPALKGVAVGTATHWSSGSLLILLLACGGLGLLAWSSWTSSASDGPQAGNRTTVPDEGPRLTGAASPGSRGVPTPADARTLTVSVRASDTGAPVPGARVRVLRALRFAAVALKQGPLEGVTDTEGRVELEVMEESPLAVSVSADAFLPADLKPVPTADADVLTVTVWLERAQTLAGRVVMPDGSPPAEVVSLHLFVYLQGTSGPGRGRTISTASDGVFRIRGLHPGSAHVRIVHTEGGRRYAAKRLVETGNEDVVIELREPMPGDGVKFEVHIQSTDGKPVSVRGLRVIGRRGTWFYRHEFTGWAGSNATVEMEYQPDLDVFVEVFDADAQLGAALIGPVSINELGVTVTLSQGRVLTGTMLGPNDDPLAGVVIQARALYPFRKNTMNAGSVHARVETDSKGQFALRGLAQCAYRLEFAVPAGLAHPGDLHVPADTRDVTIDLAAGTTAMLTVVDDEERPLPGAVATVYSPRPDTRPGSTSSDMTVFHETISAGTTDEEGHVRLTGLEEDRRYTLVVEEGKGASLRRVEQRDWLPADKQILLGERKPILGRVVYADGTPAPGSRLTWWREGTQTYHSTTVSNQQARFRIAGVVRGPWFLRATAPGGGMSADVSVDAGQRDVVLVVPKGDERWIRVTDWRLEDARTAGILLLHHDGGEDAQATVRIGDGGRIDLAQHAEAKAFSLWLGPLEAGRFVHVTERALPVRGETTVHASLGKTLAGRVIAPAGVTLEALTVEVGAPLRRQDTQQPSDWIPARCNASAGTFSIAGLPPIRTVVRARAYAKGVAYVAKGEVEPGDAVVLTLEAE